MIVADTHLIAHLLLPGDDTARAEAVFEKDPTWAAPLLWRSELRNVLATFVRRGSLDVAMALELMADAERLMEGNEYAVPSEAVLRAAAETGATAYDCEFAVLARDLSVPLITSDRGLQQAFPANARSPGSYLTDPERP